MIRDFHYLRPSSLKEALEMLSDHKEDCKVICGGQSLLILLRQGLVVTDYLLDIKGLDALNYMTFDETEGLKIGATTSHRAIEKSPLIKDKFNVLAEMESKLATIQTRNWGTIGGNLAHADPAGAPAPVLISRGASVKVGSVSGTRIIALDEFFTDLFETAMQDDELLQEIRVPKQPARAATVYEKFNLLASDQGIVAVAASVTLNGDSTCKGARIALGNAGPTVLRPIEAELLLVGQPLSDDLLEEVGQRASELSDPVSDIHASEEYRRHLIKVLTKKMVKRAWQQAETAN
jgi:carbon-monoxide dehydrogenase medium subunit